jgi:hypothetical protein
MWESLHENHPHKQIGKDIINYLITSCGDMEETPKVFEMDEKPTDAEIFEDVLKHKRFFNHLNGNFHSKFTWKHFWKGWGAMRDHGDPLVQHHIPLVAFDVISSNGTSICLAFLIIGEGLSRCIHGLPEILNVTDACVRSLNDGSPMLYSVITPAGTITSPHCDNTGSGHIILQAYGSKVVLWWDVNEAVLDHFKHIHCLRKGDLTMAAVTSWSGLHWAVLNPGEYVVLEPNQVHAVVSGNS